MRRRSSHKRRTYKYSESEYLALAKAFLGGDFDKNNLERPLRGFQNYAFQQISSPDDQGEVKSFSTLLRSLSVLYVAMEDLKKGRFPIDSPQAKAAERLADEIVSIYAPIMISSLMTGQHEAFKRLAAVVEAAKTIPPIGDQTSHDKRLQLVCKALGLKMRKPHKATGRIRLLLPLWTIGFGDLPQMKRYEILEKAGLEPKEIPEDDALRQLLTYYKIQALRKSLGSIKTSSNNTSG